MAIVINGSGTVTGISVGGLPDDIVDAGTLADNAVGLAQMASGTDGNIITYDTSGNPAVVATGSDGQVLTSAGADAVPAFEAAAAGGKILQIVSNMQAETGAHDNGDAAAYADVPDMTVTITPTATTSKILYMFNCSAHVMGSVQTFVQVLRDSTQIAYAERWSGYNSNSDWTPYPVVVQGVDSPSTTSATTYKIQAKRTGGSYFRFHDHDAGSNHLSSIAIEIGV